MDVAIIDLRDDSSLRTSIEEVISLNVRGVAIEAKELYVAVLEERPVILEDVPVSVVNYSG